MHQVLRELVLVGDDVDAGPLRYALVRLDAVQDLGVYLEIEPADVEFLGLRHVVAGVV